MRAVVVKIALFVTHFIVSGRHMEILARLEHIDGLLSFAAAVCGFSADLLSDVFDTFASMPPQPEAQTPTRHVAASCGFAARFGSHFMQGASVAVDLQLTGVVAIAAALVVAVLSVASSSVVRAVALATPVAL